MMEKNLKQVLSNEEEEKEHASHQRRNKITEASPALQQDYLERGRGSHNIFQDGDAAQLFSAPALAGSMGGIATGRGVMLSSSSPKDTHKQRNARELRSGRSNVSAQGLSDNKDTNYEKESADFGELDSDFGWVDHLGREAGDGETTKSRLQKWDQEDLVLVEGALLRMLQRKITSSSSSKRLLKQEGEEDGPKPESHGALLEQSAIGSETLDSGSWDFELLSRLLHQVQALRVEKSEQKQRRKAAVTLSQGTHDSSSSWDVTGKPPGSKEKLKLRKYEMERMVEAAAAAAEAAAAAAKAAAESAAKNGDTIQVLLQMFKGPKSRRFRRRPGKATKREDDEASDTDAQEEDEEEEEEEEKIIKKIVRQNQITHWVLGFMLVTSFIWRYIVVKVAKRVKNKVSDPLGYIGGIVTDSFKGPGKDKEDGKMDTNNTRPPLIPPVKLPSILHGKTNKDDKDDDDNKNSSSAQQPASKERQKEEPTVLNLGNFLQLKQNN